MVGLPDPTADLDWSGYVGAIHEHFRRNAEKTPNATCVLETKTSTTPERRFTYKQIYEASNTLSWYLHEKGVTNGDVVMIWAHRSVDLVIGLMGILAAGGTMTVLDPAYPPTRQKIYLEVSQPSALIKIGRATDENGPLAQLVQDYIDEELKLKAQVPELRLEDDGHLKGGDVDGKDVFASVRDSASKNLEGVVIVGPDSNPTLSFTSGSEGRPKGVLGRHYSLARYFGWMSERFHLTSQSKFTLLSGLAHDPVQRDIFTPLYLGAQLLVPSKEDIQHEKLAEWMREHKPTVTHLTPAMGQILVGGASAEFPSLEHAFFVGDVLTMKDCNALRRLAENTNIINMYGTTETQRAVSYYEIPSRARDPDYLEELRETVKDFIPAGTGMQNVQLLVVNRDHPEKLCQVGEAGEIYVRAAGLAEGYLGDEALNKQKFLPNWFIDNQKWIDEDKKINKNEPWRKYYQGPRDRLYRTGDLGRYLESGDVECIGRADDQVKIRGFRIELNEIDSNLSQSVLIRDCKTLVRRDAFEEPTLISYIVPETAEWERWLSTRGLTDVQEDEGVQAGTVVVYSKRYRRMQTEIRDHLKSRLPAYAVPTIFVILNKLPLNPNGKVDKPNLPFPDIASRTEVASEEDLKNWELLTETEKTVAEQWASLIRGVNPKTIRRENDFFDLGGHSLLAQQFSLTIRKVFGIDVSINTIYQHPTLASFSSEIDNELKGVKMNGTAVSDQESLYAKSLKDLKATLETKYQSVDLGNKKDLTVFLTGATGFLGAYLIKDLLERASKSGTIKVIAHVRGVKNADEAMQRLKRSIRGYGLWQDSWSSRLSTVVGDLARPNLGLDDKTWNNLAQTVDLIIHNGATVHWVRRYQDMMAANVRSTIDCMKLCNTGKPKGFTYVSSTSVLDTDHYISLSDKRTPVMEEDDMNGSQTGLGTGYGQTKWVSEQLVREAGKRGLHGSVVRPGYILSESETGVCNIDDFLIRMYKGCIQLKCRPKIINTVNAVPVNHVARVVVAATLNPLPDGVHVVNVTAHPRLWMKDYLGLLEYYGYNTPEVSYDTWKGELEKFVSTSTEKDQEQLALMPLYHFCMSDLPATTRAPELDDDNAIKILKSDADKWTNVDESGGYGITREDAGRLLAYLTALGFIERPSGRGRPLPDIKAEVVQARKDAMIGGRGGVL